MNINTTRLTLSDRVAIEAGVYARKTFKQIALELNKHPATISREIRNNRSLFRGEKHYGKDCRFAASCKRKNVCDTTDCIYNYTCVLCRKADCRTSCSHYDNRPCPTLDKPPYVCNICERRRRCRIDRAYYSAKQADAAAARRYAETHAGIRTKDEKLKQLDETISKLIKKGQPLTHIYAEHGDELGVSLRTLYNYIDSGAFSIGNIDLRRKLGYRPRRKKQTTSDEFLNLNFRKGRSYSDFQKYMEKHPNTPIVEMDTVKGIREQGKRLLTMIFSNNSMMLMTLMRDGTADSVAEVFDYLTSLIGVDAFRKLFPVILTDNGAEFKRVHELELTVDGTRRTRVFFCDPQASWQKPHIEKNHEFIRYVLPKGKTLNPYTQEDMTLIANHINSTRRASLNGACPYELVEEPDMQYLLSLLGMEQVPPDDIILKPKLLRSR